MTTHDAALDAWESEGGWQLDEAQRDRSQYLRRELERVSGEILILSTERHPACLVIPAEAPVDDADEDGSIVRAMD